MKVKCRLLFLAVTVYIFPSSLSVVGLEAFDQNKKTLHHEVTVSLKLVQVYVTDKQGKPVMDLGKHDFELFDNSKPQPITHFEKHELFLPEKKTKEAIPTYQVPQLKMNRKFFLLFDFAFNNALGIEKSKKAALHFIDSQVLPTDEVGIFSYSRGKGLTLHEFLTKDRNKLREVIEGFGLKNILGRAQDVESAYWSSLQAMTGELSLANPVRAGGEEALLIEKQKLKEATIDRLQYQLDVRNFVSQMSDLAKALRYVPGYKSVLFFSSGIASSAFQGPPIAIDRSELASSYWTKGTLYNINSLDAAIWEEEKYVNMIKEFSSSNSPIYVLNTEELIAQDFSKNKAMTGEYSLKKMAEISGGKYFPYVHEYKIIAEEIQNLTGSYYVLGYYIDEKWDGKYNKIKIKVRRKGCRVQAQSGYFNPKPFQKFTDFENKLHLIDLALSENPLFQTPHRFLMKAMPYSGREKQNIAIWAKVGKEKIQEIAGEKVEIVMIIFDKKENIVKIERKEADFSKLPEGNIYFSSFLFLNPGDYRCRLVIRNLESGRGAVASSLVLVPEVPGEGIRLYSPLLLKGGKDGFYFKVSSTAPPDFSFDTKLYSPLIEELEQGTGSLFAVIRCSFGGIQKPEIKLLANLLQYQADRAKAISAPISILENYRRDDAEIFFLRIQTEGLEPGEYVLYLFAEEFTTGSKSQANTSFRIERAASIDKSRLP